MAGPNVSDGLLSLCRFHLHRFLTVTSRKGSAPLLLAAFVACPYRAPPGAYAKGKTIPSGRDRSRSAAPTETAAPLSDPCVGFTYTDSLRLLPVRGSGSGARRLAPRQGPRAASAP
jgi:hypothetical protein